MLITPFSISPINSTSPRTTENRKPSTTNSRHGEKRDFGIFSSGRNNNLKNTDWKAAREKSWEEIQLEDEMIEKEKSLSQNIAQKDDNSGVAVLVQPGLEKRRVSQQSSDNFSSAGSRGNTPNDLRKWPNTGSGGQVVERQGSQNYQFYTNNNQIATDHRDFNKEKYDKKPREEIGRAHV